MDNANLGRLIDTATEQAICGAVMLEPQMALRVRDTVALQDFADSDLGEFFSLLCDLVDCGSDTSDMRLIRSSALERKNLWSRIGGATGINAMMNACGSPASIVDYAKRIVALACRRRLVETAAKIYSKAQDMTEEVDDIVSWGQASLGYASKSSDADVHNIDESMRHFLHAVESSKKSGKPKSMPTGLLSVDSVTGGVFYGDMTVIACRPSVGKTSLGAQLAQSAANLGKRVLFCTIEMDHKSIACRYLAQHLSIENRVLRAGYVDESDIAKGYEVATGYEGTCLQIWHPKKKPTVAQISARARVMAASGGLDLLVVDYLQMVRPLNQRLDKTEQLSQISGDMKEIANQCGCALLVMAQLNRGSEGTTPKLSDLKGSGSIEEDADNVWLVDRARDGVDVSINIAKARNGAVGGVTLRFTPETTRFSDLQN